MISTLHVGDVGTIIRLTVLENGQVKDLSTATDTQIKIVKPNASVVVRTATFSTDGTDGRLQIEIQANDLDIPGVYSFVAYFTINSWTGHTSAATVKCMRIGL